MKVADDAGAFCRRYARTLGDEPDGIRVKEQKHLWGSCGKDRIINLNWRLVFMPRTVLQYVVVHELCHLRHRNHSPAFWSLVKQMMPDYERPKLWLEEKGAGYDL